MKFYVFGDIHGNLPAVQQILTEKIAQDGKPDAFLLVGDIGANYLPRYSKYHEIKQTALLKYTYSLVDVLTLFQKLEVPYFWVSGNHDLPPEDLVCQPMLHPFLEGYLENGSGLVEFNGVQLLGLGGCPRPYGFPYHWTDDDRDLQDIVSQADIIISHCPPRDILDLTRDGDRVGSLSLTKSLSTQKEQLIVCGHIHEAYGVVRKENLRVMNCGALGHPFPKPLLGVVEFGDTISCHLELFPNIKFF